MADIEGLLAPISEANPAGEDLSYDHERQKIEQAFESNDNLDGEAAEERDWRLVIRQIESQFDRTKDVWLAVYLARAGARSGSLETVELGAGALAGLFERYWDTVHPQLEELGVFARKAPCDSLASRGEFLLPLERTVLVAHPRLGAFSAQDFERFRTEQEAADGYGLFRAALEDLGDAPLNAAIERLAAIENAFRRVDGVFAAAAAGDMSPNFTPAFTALASMRQAVARFLVAGGEQGASSDETSGGETGGAAPQSGAGGGARLTGKVQTRDDVITALDAIADYYRRVEPSHPIQQIALRAKHWVTMDFMQLMKEIAPDAAFQAAQLLNKRDE